MSSPSKSRFLNLPAEVRLRIYWCYIAKCRAILFGNNDYTVGNNEPLADLRVGKMLVGKKVYYEFDDSLGLDLCFVCRQISAELVPFFAANTKLYLGDDHRMGSAHLSVIPRWYAADLQEVVFAIDEIGRACLAFFPNLKRAKSYPSKRGRLPLPHGTLKRTKADVEKEAVVREISSEAIETFTAERSATDKAVAGRAFSVVVAMGFGNFIAGLPGRDPMVFSTLVSSIDLNIVGTTNWCRKSRLRRALFMESLVSTPCSRRTS